MRTMCALIGCPVVVIGLLLVCPAASSVAAQPDGVGASDRVVVVFNAPASPSERAAARDAADATIVRSLGRARFQLLEPGAGETVQATVAALRDDPSVAAADADVSFAASSVPNDPLFGSQWGLQNLGQNVDFFAGSPLPGADIDATQAWDRTVGDPSVVVADIDFGYRFDHPDLAPVAWYNPGEIPGDGIDNDNNGYVDDWRGWNTFSHNNNPTASSATDATDPASGDAHGVHTAGIIGAKGNNATGVTGVTQNIRIMPLKACDTAGGGCDLSAVVEAMNYAGANGARAANMSINRAGVFPTILAAQAANQQTLFVVAAGNDGTNDDTSPKAPCDDPTVAVAGYTPPPGTIDNVVCVAATDPADQLAPFSNYGANSVDLGAPGVIIKSTLYDLVDQQDFDPAIGLASWTTPVPPASDANSGWDLTPFGTRLTLDQNPATTQGTTRATQTPATPIPAGFTECNVNVAYASVGEAGEDRFTMSVLVDGAPVISNQALPMDPSFTGSSVEHPHDSGLFDIDSATSHTVAVQFSYYRGLNDAAPFAFGQVNRLRVDCRRATTTMTYGYDTGTSMAAPMVTGTVGLLFSIKPSATVTQVRDALLAGVDPLASLAGKTTTGGRLNAWKALAALVPMDTRITSGPSGNANGAAATFTFDTNDTGNAGFECQLDTDAFVACSSPQTYPSLPVGEHTFRVRSTVAGGADSTPASREWTVGVVYPDPGAPALIAGTSPNASGVFTLGWTGTDPAGSGIRYALQHRDADDADWSNVAAGIAALSQAFSANGEGEGTWTYRVQGSDTALGLTTAWSAASSQVKVDKSAPNAPTVTADRAPDYAGGGGWYRNTVTATFTDNGDPALQDGSSGTGVNAASLPAPATKSTSGAFTISGSVSDNIGNVSPAGSLGVQVDATDPTIAFTTCPTAVLLNAPATNVFAATDAHSGLASPAAGTTTINTTTVGPKATSKTATDNVGRTSNASCTTQVQYRYGGLQQPVNIDGSSIFKLNSAVPLKFQLTDSNGQPISNAVATLSVAKITNAVEGTFAEAEAKGNSSSGNVFSQDGSGQYHYNLDSKTMSTGTWSLRITLNDGTTYTTHISLR